MSAWYAKETSAGQGLVIDEETGETIAVTYRPENGPIIADLYAENQRLRSTMDYCATVIENHKAHVLHGGKPMMEKGDAEWLARKLRAAPEDTP